MSTIADNLDRLNAQIAAAAERAGRRADEITLVAVTKKQSAATVAEALAAGAGDVGENYVQETAEKQAEVTGGRWHLLGHLQTNKAKLAVSLFELIQSVDSIKLAQALGRHAQAASTVQAVLLQVHLGDEATKTGVSPGQARDMAAEIAAMEGIALRGLMGIAPFGVDPRPHFRDLGRLFEALPPENRHVLSMGMSGDFEAAIEAGTTMVRIGTAIFGART